MKNGKQILLIVLGIFFMNCSNVDEYLTKDEKTQKQLTIKTAKKLQKEKGLYFSGFGGNGPNKKWDLMMLSLDYYQPLDIKLGRELLMYAVQTYLHEINSNEKIRPFLIHYPFTYKDIEVAIFIQNPKENPFDLAVIDCLRGEFYYKTEEALPLHTRFKETYEEAVKILEQQKNQK